MADDGAVAVHVVYKVGLQTVDYLYAVLLAGLPHVGKGLSGAVVCDGNGGHAPICGALYKLTGVGKCVQCGKAGVGMQLNALFGGIIGADIALALHDVSGVKNNIAVIF